MHQSFREEPRIVSKGWGMFTSPPWSRMRLTASPGVSPLGMVSRRNIPMISPWVVRISSATMTRKGAIFCIFKAPSAVPWSATAMQLMPSSRQRLIIFSRGVLQSMEYSVWI
ncbi:MAG: hypothetical protein A2Z05_08840 [Chloroflexi bacterium RBG_16_60_22]|nr:MAG: hypothetical protein A2Z05_08840 [Chloroflexi bacterium RBG_16_60_22]